MGAGDHSGMGVSFRKAKIWRGNREDWLFGVRSPGPDLEELSPIALGNGSVGVPRGDGIDRRHRLDAAEPGVAPDCRADPTSRWVAEVFRLLLRYWLSM